MPGKRSLALAGHHEHAAALQPVPLDGSGGPPNKGIIIDQIPGLPYCVLVVDQSPTVRHIVKTCLERNGMAVFGCATGDQALQWLEKKICNLNIILLDVDVPLEDWFPVTHYVRSQAAYSPTAIIALSCKKSEPECDQEVQTGIRDYLIKPFLPQDLLHIVQRNLRVLRTR